jgi:hypothetical protein
MTTMAGRREIRLPTHSGIAHLMIWQVGALAAQVAAVWLARSGSRGLAEVLSYPAIGAAFGSALWVLTRTDLNRAARNAAVVCLGVTPAVMWRSTNPVLFTGFDEQLHMRTLADIIESHRLFEANPLLGVSPRYPGLEATTALLNQVGLPAMAAALVVILAARVVLVTALCDVVEQLTGSARAGGLAVAVYAVSPQFVFFNSQFSYQTLALPLALVGVSLIVRSRRSDRPLPLLAGATVCLAGVAMTHHVASFVTSVLLLAWALAERGPIRIRVVYGALAAVAATLAWALLQSSMLQDYFGPIIDDVRAQIAGGERRRLFSDSAGTATSVLDRALLVYFAAALTIVALGLTALTLRRWRRGEHHWHIGRPHRLRRGPHLLVLSLVAMTPLLLAARVLPKGGELFDRGSSFLFFPVSLFVAGFAAAHWWPSAGQTRTGVTWCGRAVAIVLATGMFLGGYVLGSGPNWARLPGPYMAAADTRSMDAETLAAVEWVDDALPDGSRIAADRVSSVLLAAKAGVWPVLKGKRGVDAAALYFAETWDQRQTDMAAAMRLRYLYVDLRLADELPHFGSYFFSGETGFGRQFTDDQLTKFATTAGVSLVYRHGPVSIYDLKGLGLPELRSGWFGDPERIAVGEQLIAGLLGGLAVVLAMSGRIWLRIRRGMAAVHREAGPALLAGIVLAGCCLASVALLMAGVWLTPLSVLTAFLVVALARPTTTVAVARTWRPNIPRRRLVAAGLVSVPVAAILGFAVSNAAGEAVVRVRQILSNPAAVQVEPTTPPG